MMTNKGFNLFEEYAARCVFAKKLWWQNFVLPLW